VTVEWPQSIREINSLPESEKHEIYRFLLPDWLYTRYGIAGSSTSLETQNPPLVIFRCPSGSRAVEISVKRHLTDRDPMMYLHMTDTFNNQLLVLLVVVNDPDAPRFNTDIDLNGNPTNYGTASRNIPAELAAMAAGLAPGQIRQGLRVFKEMVPVFDEFVPRIGHDMYFIEPLAYHNAITFERYGFSYLKGLSEMRRINDEFQPGGELHKKLGPTPGFRHYDVWKTVRGRSWAIHDGILGHPFTGFQMYKQIGKPAGINTFPAAKW